MSDKKHENYFKFGIYTNSDTIIERIFSADQWNPVVRYAVDIRELIPSVINRIKKTLSNSNLTYYDHNYNLLDHYEDNSKFLTKGEPNKLGWGNNKSKSEEIKFGLYINNNPIVERSFTVDRYKSSSRFSIEIVELINDIVIDIESHMRDKDISHMWDDFFLINHYNLNIQQVRDLNDTTRKAYLKKIDDKQFVLSVKKKNSVKLNY